MRRLDVLRSKLPDDVLARILLFDSHPLADLVKQLEFEPVSPSPLTSAGLVVSLKKPLYFVPVFREFRRRIQHNSTRHLHGGVWLPLFTRYRCWRLIFDRWMYETVPEIDYLSDWVKEQFQEDCGQERTSANPGTYICKPRPR